MAQAKKYMSLQEYFKKNKQINKNLITISQLKNAALACGCTVYQVMHFLRFGN